MYNNSVIWSLAYSVAIELGGTLTVESICKGEIELIVELFSMLRAFYGWFVTLGLLSNIFHICVFLFFPIFGRVIEMFLIVRGYFFFFFSSACLNVS